MIKNDIATHVRTAFVKAGYKVFSFGRRVRYDIGQKDWVDIVCVSKKQVVFIEVKVGKDKLSPGQEETAALLMDCEAVTDQAIRYVILTDKNYKDMVCQILEGR